MKQAVNSYMRDIDDYLTFAADYGKPNYKYFNFVLNRMGVMFIYLSK